MQVILWCWDARMGWDDQPEAVLRSMANPAKPFPYPKRPEAGAESEERSDSGTQ